MRICSLVQFLPMWLSVVLGHAKKEDRCVNEALSNREQRTEGGKKYVELKTSIPYAAKIYLFISNNNEFLDHSKKKHSAVYGSDHLFTTDSFDGDHNWHERLRKHQHENGRKEKVTIDTIKAPCSKYAFFLRMRALSASFGFVEQMSCRIITYYS